MSNEFVNRRNIQWFPGHMAKTLRLIEANLKNVDVVLQLLDARIPLSSLNPELQRLTASKPRLYVMNKADLADPALTKAWQAYFRAAGAGCVAISAKQKGSAGQVRSAIESELRELLEKRAGKGMAGARIRVMVVGIPNVGKSSFINRMILGGGAGKAAVQDRPGVTRQNRWFTVGKGFELLDTPGVLWPKFEDPIVGEHLAFTGAVRDEILDMESLAARLLELLMELYPNAINSRYKTDIRPEEHLPGHELLERVGRKRGMLVSGGEVNTERAAITVLDEYRGGKLGRITLEQP